MLDRRASERVSYPFQQRMRPAEISNETEIAVDSQLFHDVALGGCSFWSTRPLRGQRLWIELGLDHDCLTRLAEVCHETEVRCLAQPLYLVGCRFVRPILHAAGSDLAWTQN